MTMFSPKPAFDLKAFLAEPAAVKGSRGKKSVSAFAKAQKARREKSTAEAEESETASKA